MRCSLALPLPLLVAMTLPGQTRLALDGTWELAVEPAAGTTVVYDRTASVPAEFETALGAAFDGVAWYRRPLPLRPEWRGASIRVEFAAVATATTVFCNGTKVAEHLGAWTPFRAELSAALRWDGTDQLEVRVDEKVGHNTQGFLPVIQPHFGGIWQSVTLCVDRTPVIDRLTLATFGRIDADAGDPATATVQAVATCKVAVLPHAGATANRLRVELLDGAVCTAVRERALDADDPTAPPVGLPIELSVSLPLARAWRPAAPHLFCLRITALDAAGRTLDWVERRIGFRSLRADGTTIRWNGQPLQVRGILHWGYSPPHLAPPSDREFWRRQLEDFRGLGFNLLKCCLWVPPPCVYELCDELGMLCWQEYPTWHPAMDQAHRTELLREYGEFYLHDGSHPSVAFRSITCETGHQADLGVVRALFEACHTAIPDTLVVDDSSWIGWQRVTDFWDEHPYGNNRWWPGRLAGFRDFVASNGSKPLLLGECIAADTWFDLRQWQRRCSDAPQWWQPDCLDDQRHFEDWIRRQFGEPTLRSLGPIARDHALASRRYQIERLRATIPDAGYVVSVARDFGKARMGLYDDFDRLKWSAADWSWHGDTMLCLDTDQRAFCSTDGVAVTLSMRVAHGADRTSVATAIALDPLPVVRKPTRHAVVGTAAGRRARWDVWLLPPFDDARPDGIAVVDELDPSTLDSLERGGRVLLRVTGKVHSLGSEPMWYLRGAPFAPPHPVHALLPPDMLIELQPFDLDGGRLMPWALLRDQVDPILAFWETHDIAEVRAHLFAFDCRVGNGRLVASCFDPHSTAGRYVEHCLLQHLARGPAPQRELAPATLAALRQLLRERTLPLATWRFRTDPDDAGAAAGWFRPATDAGGAPWRDLQAGSHWENQAEDLRHYDGVAWYRIDVELPADWPDDGPESPTRAVFEGVDDSFELWLDGASLGRRGDPATGVTVWLQPQVFEIPHLQPGRHTLVLRVVDHNGAGGLWKPAMLTTGPVGPVRALLQ